MAEKSKQSGELAALKKQCEDCCKQLAALKKEVAALKKAKSSGGADPRLDKLISFVKHFYRASVRTKEDAIEMNAIEKELF